MSEIKKTFRFNLSTAAELESLAKRDGVTQSEALRRAIHKAAQTAQMPDAAIQPAVRENGPQNGPQEAAAAPMTSTVDTNATAALEAAHAAHIAALEANLADLRKQLDATGARLEEAMATAADTAKASSMVAALALPEPSIWSRAGAKVKALFSTGRKEGSADDQR